MALTSRLSIEVDSRSAEQKVNDLRRALQALNDAGLRTAPVVNGAGNAINGAGQNARSATAQVQGLERQVKSLGSVAAGIAGPLAAAFSAKAFYDAAEAYSTLTNRMKLVTDGADQLADAQKAVFAIAQSSFQPLNATAELYQRIATNQKELKLTGDGVAGVVGTISKTLAISGASAASASAALVQLGQAFASGVLRGEELNSVMEQAPALAQAIAAGMGKTVGELRTLGAAGLLTADAVVKALQAQRVSVDELFSKTNVTIGNSLTAVGNSFTQLVGKLDQASGASLAISSNFVALSKSMDALSATSGSLSTTISAVGAAMSGIGAAGAVLLANKLGTVLYAYTSTRAAAITQATATLNSANADVIKARTAAAAAKADMVLYRGTILQTVAAGRYAETRLLQAASDERARIAALGLATAQRGLLALLGGPAGIALAVGAVAASMFLMRDNTDEASKALDQQGLSVNEIIKKYDALNSAQQRVKRLEWIDQQATSIASADEALKSYVDRVKNGALSGYMGSIGIGPLTGEFQNLIKEVRDGKRDLDSVNQWLKQSIDLSNTAEKALAKDTAEYQKNVDRNKELANVLGQVNGEQMKTAQSASALAAAQAASGTQTKAQLAEWQKYIAKLTEARDLVGANEKAEAAYRAGKMGLTKEQAAQAGIVAEQTDLLKKYEDAVKTADKAQQTALRNQLIALYTQQQAAEDSTAAVKKSHEDAAKAAEESANKQIEQMQRVINAALKLQGGPQIDLGMPKKRTGYDLLTNGASPLAPTRLTPAQLADRQLQQITEGTKPNKNAGKEKAYQEDAGTKMLDDARQRYAVLVAQSKELLNQDGTTKSIGAEQKKLVELETEIAQLKEKKTLTSSQKQVLAMAELNIAQQKQNASLEKEVELRKLAAEETQKMISFQANLNSQLSKDQVGLSNSLAGQGMGDQARARLQEEFGIQEQYQSQLDNLLQQRNEGKISQDLYGKETNALNAALQSRLAMQQKYYSDVDKAQSDWTLGASSALENYLEQSRDVAGQTKQLFTNAFSGMEDAVVNFVKTGKLSFKDFANGVIEDLIRIQVRQAAAGFLSTAFSFLSGGSAALGQGTMTGSSQTISQSGFSSGGYTGDGGKFEPKGVVHGGEFVVKKEVVSQPGAREFLERMNASTKGYADGGYVGKAATTASSSSAQQTASPGTNGPAIHQSFQFQGTPDESTLSMVKEAAYQGAKGGYEMVMRDFKINGPIRQLAARR
ncbi:MULTISPECIES: phage tail tape measure protein [Pseudomonas syringae group]|uniref:phage tail tape measure protein n=1 Tax=Pseudomonas syringae group TaxID=136849 RepID=UPI0005165C9F|nr:MULTISPECIES: phage tail tape measure protein [Pseudomonas syringae group]MBM1212540.1 phage tail tape measure protein [Pseudomonas syringae]MBM1218280.1 phage tail tape measure protein [Pseudomonas syringae]MBX6404063.1 phage tail tape measure protein [Pseudomonas syringae pv. tomato]MBX6408172.1 phage tail tape measure protein [Pseudomonas syringae pv. tomato]MBX6432853.1 phage tail tape measure protein [Pseudomonas syringae pv. tomato]